MQFQDWFRQKNTDPTIRPFAVIVKSTDVCQYACKYCYVESQQDIKIMSVDTAKILIDKVLDYIGSDRKISIVWHGGEPLIAGLTFFEEVANYLGQFASHSIENCLQTNGAMIDKDVLRFCKENNFRVSISLDGPKQLHDSNRVTAQRNGTFDKTMESIEQIRTFGLTPACVCVLSRTNIGHIDEMYRFFRDAKIHFRINPVVRSGRAAIHYNNLAITAKEYGEAMCKLFDLWFDDEGVIRVEPLHTILGNFIGQTVWGCDYHGRCLESIISINPDGSIYPCGRFAGMEEYRLGNVHETQSLARMNQSEQFQRINSRTRETVQGCSICDFVEICNAGCMITAHMARGDILDRDYYCKGKKVLFGHIAKRLTEHLTHLTFN
jgi:uncharacterized protein